MIKIKQNLNIFFLTFVLFQVHGITASSSVNQTNYNNAFLTFYKAIKGSEAPSISAAAQYIQSIEDSQTLTFAKDIVEKSLQNTPQALRVAAFLSDVTPALEATRLKGLDSQPNLNAAFAAAQGLTAPITSNPTTSNPTTSNPTTSSTTSNPTTSNPTTSSTPVTAIDTAAKELLQNIQSSIGTYNQYLSSLNKGIPALAVPTTPAGVPAV